MQEVSERLLLIFPEGLAQRNYFIRLVAAQTVFVMLYVGAVESSGVWFRPNQVSRMTDDQAARVSATERVTWAERSLRPRSRDARGARGWIADTSREPVRDETLRNALVLVGAVVQRENLDTTSSKPRWALASDFVVVLTCSREEVEARAAEWRSRHLSTRALSRLTLSGRRITAASAGDSILVSFPNGESRRMSGGQSTQIAKAVIEEFTQIFMADAGVLWVSESQTKVTLRDDELARKVGFEIDTQIALPDIILVDLGIEHPVFVFVEIVASDGPIDEQRRAVLLEMLRAAGHAAEHAAFVTAFWDRELPAYRKASSTIAGNTFVWTATEPAMIVVVRDTTGQQILLYDMLD